MSNRIKTQNSCSKGFVLTLEVTISVLLFTLLLLSLPHPNQQSLKELVALQQANDLLRVWSISYPSEAEMHTDTNNLFGNNAGVWINGKQVFFGKTSANSIATEGILLDKELTEKKVKIIVYFIENK